MPAGVVPLYCGVALHGHLDEAGEFAIHGWAHDDLSPDQPLTIEILIGGTLAGAVQADLFRYDLRDAGFGDGCKAFWFNPFEHWTGIENTVQIRVAGSDRALPNGSQTVRVRTLQQKHALWESKRESERRWRNSLPGPALTWDSWMTGDSFVDQVDRFFQFKPDTEILEIGPGYGRLLKTLLARQKQFLRFVGVDLSRACTAALRQQYQSARMQFFAGNGDTYPYPQSYNLILASATFEHLFPSIAACLAHLSQCMRPGARMFADFISHDGSLSISRAYFEPEQGAFIRIYSEQELRKFFADAGLDVIELVHPLVLGNAAEGSEIRRALVVAAKNSDSM
jgi:SAM-dependent methyltransferase